MTRTALAIRHVHFETLGTFEQALEEAGYTPGYADVATGGLADVDPLAPDLLVVLGGPIGVYETEAYPFLDKERALIRTRLDAGLPILGICLGAQLIAAALGAGVGPTGVKEIGFAPVDLTEAGKRGPLRHLAGVPVLHWHGDAFDLPAGAELLATTAIANQAFSIGAHVLGLQFHPEADTGHDLEAWLIGHAAELAGAGIDPRRIRADARTFGPALRDAGRAAFAEWLSQL
ncbi:glutamine amidotransferase [Pseudochelatococcus sp. B33]